MIKGKKIKIPYSLFAQTEQLVMDAINIKEALINETPLVEIRIKITALTEKYATLYAKLRDL